MKKGAPVKEMFRLTWLMAGFMAVMIFFFKFIETGLTPKIFIAPTLIGSLFFFMGLVNITLLKSAPPTIYQPPIKKHWKWYLLSFFCSFVVVQLYWPVFAYFADENWHRLNNMQHFITFTMISVLFNILTLSMQLFVCLLHEKAKADVENAQLKTANMQAVNALLRQQIHPHFLFNALSVLKTLYKSDTRAGEHYLGHLANFLRASLSDVQEKMVKLGDEINLCNDYLEMQRLRFGKALAVDIDLPADTLQEGQVPSFSIQPLLENAIKHNEVTEAAPLHIRVYCQEPYLVVCNNLQLKRHPEPSSGKGLLNLMERYRLLSNEEVLIDASPEHFSVSIKILHP
ncbi:MAG: histidine kinase [Candidatus Pseudobacter hemicellulosilyticus]|uniref:Histidine kinase n=1 Tax=Candidatus Pseudobacter hemicellulosilyticus TaxID=3121375 RepID=A0AAJ5WPC9_9BACT|nr:MAG: histidine kinase [Pseudobacter sp.]